MIFYDVSIVCRGPNVSALKYFTGSPASEEDERGWTSVRDRHGFDPIWSSDTAVAQHHFEKGRCALTQWPKTSYSPLYFLFSHACAHEGYSGQNGTTEITGSHLGCCTRPQGQASGERGACALHSKVEPRGTATARESDAERALGAYACSFGRFASPTKCRYSAARAR